MKQIFVYADSLSWGLIPNTRQRLEFDQRWPGVLEHKLKHTQTHCRVSEDCLNGRRTVWDDPFKPGRNGKHGLAQKIEALSPLDLVIICLGTNDFQSMHENDAWHSSQGIATLVNEIRTAPIEPGMSSPEILIVCPPLILEPKGQIAPKFLGANKKCQGLSAAFASVAELTACHFFDANTVTTSSSIDGVHIDADQHLILGEHIAHKVKQILC